MTTQAVIFDCDGVLVDSERLVTRVESEHLQRLGLALSPEEARARFMGLTVTDTATWIEERIGKSLPPEWLHDWGLWTALTLSRSLRAVPGVSAIVEHLHRHGVPMCVASQSPLPRVQLSLEVTGLAQYFDERVFTASMVTRPKPAPDLFLYAAKKIGMDARSCVVVEDSPSGVAAAVAAEMDVLGYAAESDAGSLAAAGAAIFHAMGELPELLRRRGLFVR
jgi:HAD superfamily hydrolase (TIGR01509 family)